MTDPRYDDLANVLINHSTKLKKGEKILIEAIDVPDEVVGTIIRKVDEIGALAFITVKHNRILRELYSTASEQSMKLAGEFEAARMEKMDAYIALRGSYNVAELSDVPQDKTVYCKLVETRSHRYSCTQDEMGSAALASPLYGSTSQYEHKRL